MKQKKEARFRDPRGTAGGGRPPGGVRESRSRRPRLSLARTWGLLTALREPSKRATSGSRLEPPVPRVCIGCTGRSLNHRRGVGGSVGPRRETGAGEGSFGHGVSVRLHLLADRADPWRAREGGEMGERSMVQPRAQRPGELILVPGLAGPGQAEVHHDLAVVDLSRIPAPLSGHADRACLLRDAHPIQVHGLWALECIGRVDVELVLDRRGFPGRVPDEATMHCRRTSKRVAMCIIVFPSSLWARVRNHRVSPTVRYQSARALPGSSRGKR